MKLSEALLKEFPILKDASVL